MKSRGHIVLRDKRLYAREFWRTALTLVLLAAVVGLAACVLSGVLGWPSQ